MLFRFALIVTAIEVVLTAGASAFITMVEVPVAFVTESDLRGLGLPFESHECTRAVTLNAPCFDTRARLQSPTATLYTSLRTGASETDFEFRRAREELIRDHPERGEMVIINEPLPGERGYAVRHRGPKSVRFELVRLRGKDMLIVRVIREQPYDTLPAAELSRCERRARAIQEHLMLKMRWRD